LISIRVPLEKKLFIETRLRFVIYIEIEEVTFPFFFKMQYETLSEMEVPTSYYQVFIAITKKKSYM